MKGTEIFKKTIADYLQVRANADDLFAKSFAKEGKSIDKCVNYILNKVKESGCNGFTDDEIYGMAVHYYDEDDIKEEETKCHTQKKFTQELFLRIPASRNLM